LCLDKGYNFQEFENGVIKKGYLRHIRHRGEESVIKIKDGDQHAKRRWVVERINSWHNRFRKLWLDLKSS
ncbi:MAG: hypothetical protein WBQ25_12340, partial [Nitrososphaeraceae archaeon]